MLIATQIWYTKLCLQTLRLKLLTPSNFKASKNFSMINPDLIPDSWHESPKSEWEHGDFPAALEAYCQEKGTDPSTLIRGAIDYSPELEVAVKARAAIRDFLNGGK
jgi:hypothetical protein